MKTVMKATAAAALVGSVAMSTTAHASGFEKSIVWGGHSGGVAGIATPYVQGADALYFNPAGLVADKAGNSLSFNISPTAPTFKGPINNSNTTSETESKVVFPVALNYGYTMNEQWGFGAGFFVSGGAQASYKDIDMSAATGYKPEVKTDLQIFEASAGVGYKATENLKLGLAWRVVMAQADFSFVRRSSATGVVNAKLTGLKDTQAVAFRAGAQYKVDDATSLALTFRSEVNFKASGKIAGQVFNTASAAGIANPAITESDATARTTFPMAITLGGMHKLNDDWNLLGEYVWTQYSRVGEIPVETNSALIGNTSVQTDWRDQHNIRVAAEYNTPWPVRFGYVWTNTVTNSDYARASFTPPAPAHTLTLGTGKGFSVGDGADQNLRFDAAFEYTFSSADVSDKAAAGTTGAGTDTRNGTYSVTAYVAHLGLSYMF